MTKTEKEYFKVYEIYGIRKNDLGKWVAFNRDYKPLGVVAKNYTEKIPDDEFLTIGIPDDISKAKLETIVWDTDKGMVTEDGKDFVFLYRDTCSPVKGKMYLNKYNVRLKNLRNHFEMSGNNLESFDPQMDFEKLVPKFLGVQNSSVYISNFWKNKSAILYTICFSQYYTKLHADEVNEKLSYFMKNVIEEVVDEISVAVECIRFLETIPNKSTFK